jgi:hypothetical protein
LKTHIRNSLSWLKSLFVRKRYWLLSCQSGDIHINVLHEGGIAELHASFERGIVIRNAMPITKADYLIAKKIKDERKAREAAEKKGNG